MIAVRWGLAFLGCLVAEYLLQRWMEDSRSGRPGRAAALAAAVRVCGMLATLAAVDDWPLVVPCALGDSVGTYLGARRCARTAGTP